MVDVYYPYFQTEARWQELRYSLRSIEKHFKFDFRVWIVGDLPSWVQNVNHIPHNRCRGMQENTTYDAISKMTLFMDHPEIRCCFIRMYDDIYLLADVTRDDIARPKAMPGEIPGFRGVWVDQLRRTIEAVKKRGFTGWNTETHLPELFDKELMQAVIKSYDALNNRYLTSTLYNNTWHKDDEILVISKEMAVQFYDATDGLIKCSNRGNIEQKCKGATYLNHNNAGLNDALKRFIMRRFPEKSRFEK